jgi:hypothetical protein
MRRILFSALFGAAAAVSVLAGALTLRIEDTTSGSEKAAGSAAVVVRTTACNSPEKTTITASAEGLVNGVRRSIPLQVAKLSEPGLFAVAKQWPNEGRWTISFTATNPDYRNYATGLIVPVSGSRVDAKAAKVFYHPPSTDDVNAILKAALD